MCSIDNDSGNSMVVNSSDISDNWNSFENNDVADDITANTKRGFSVPVKQTRDKHGSDTSSRRPLLPPCVVCGVTSTGFHYGANTCEACKVKLLFSLHLFKNFYDQRSLEGILIITLRARTPTRTHTRTRAHSRARRLSLACWRQLWLYDQYTDQNGTAVLSDNSIKLPYSVCTYLLKLSIKIMNGFAKIKGWTITF
jgi:hypothetical protein